MSPDQSPNYQAVQVRQLFKNQLVKKRLHDLAVKKNFRRLNSTPEELNPEPEPSKSIVFDWKIGPEQEAQPRALPVAGLFPADVLEHYRKLGVMLINCQEALQQNADDQVCDGTRLIMLPLEAWAAEDNALFKGLEKLTAIIEEWTQPMTYQEWTQMQEVHKTGMFIPAQQPDRYVAGCDPYANERTRGEIMIFRQAVRINPPDFPLIVEHEL